MFHWLSSLLSESKRQRIFYEEQYHESERERKKLLHEFETLKTTAVRYCKRFIINNISLYNNYQYNNLSVLFIPSIYYSPYVARAYPSGRNPEDEQVWKEEENKANNTLNSILQIDLMVTSVYLFFSLLFFHQGMHALSQ